MSEARVRDRGTEDGQRRIGLVDSPRNVEDKRVETGRDQWVNYASIRFLRLDAHIPAIRSIRPRL